MLNGDLMQFWFMVIHLVIWGFYYISYLVSHILLHIFSVVKLVPEKLFRQGGKKLSRKNGPLVVFYFGWLLEVFKGEVKQKMYCMLSISLHYLRGLWLVGFFK